MQLPKSSYYYKPKPKPSDKQIRARIEDLCLQYPKYGYRRITKQLHREGTIVNHKRVARIMRENGWSCRPAKKKWVRTTNSKHGYRIYPNLVKDLKVDAINQVWVADITFVATWQGFVHVAFVIDVFARYIVGGESAGRCAQTWYWMRWSRLYGPVATPRA